MQWWNDFVLWFYSEDGWRVISTAILPFLAILLAGLFAALIARRSIKRLLEHQLREAKSSAIAALIGAGRKASIWNTLGDDEKRHVDNLLGEAEIRVRLLPMPGVSAAADWAAHELASMKHNSATFSFQAEQTFVQYRDRLLEWQDKPRRAKKLFAEDLEQWKYESVDKNLADKQVQWETAHAPETEYAPEPARDEAGFHEDDYDEGPPATAVPRAQNRDLAPTPPMPTELRNKLVSESVDPYAPPVTAGTVRQRITPDGHNGL